MAAPQPEAVMEEGQRQFQESRQISADGLCSRGRSEAGR